MNKILFLTLSFIIFLSQALLAAPGDLDRSYGIEGVLKNPDFISSDINGSFLPDGKFMLVHPGIPGTFWAARFQADGSPDPTFGNNGRIMIDTSPRAFEPAGVTIQSDGKILIYGRSRAPEDGGFFDMTIVRLTTSAVLDTSFDGDGIAVVTRAGTDERSGGVVIQPDNRIVVGGDTYNGFTSHVMLARYDPDGSLDPTFGNNGIAINQAAPHGMTGFTIALQSNGKLVVAGNGRLQDFSHYNFAATRHNVDGSIDTAFGNNGFVLVDVRAKGEAIQNGATAIVIQPDGRIVVGGASNSGLTSFLDFALLRLNIDGSIDTDFGNNGFVVTPGPSDHEDTLTTLLLQPDGKILAGGAGRIRGDDDFMLVRYESDGSQDRTFGVNGVQILSDVESGEKILDLRLLEEGKIFAAGTANSTTNFARYQATGVREADFDSDKRADISVFRPSTGTWYVSGSAAGYSGLQFGISTDQIVPADYDGDGVTDFGVYRDGTWYLQQSTDGFSAVTFGLADDIPQPGDFDGDGKSEVAVFRPSTGDWYLLNLATSTFTAYHFGSMDDKPVVGDYDGDGRADFAVFRPSSGTWYHQGSTSGFSAVQFGVSTDKPVPSDYDGDGKTDQAVYREGTWYLNRSFKGFTSISFGIAEDTPVPADYDGDGRADIAVYRASQGTWYLLKSHTNQFESVQFGILEDQPVPSSIYN